MKVMGTVVFFCFYIFVDKLSTSRFIKKCKTENDKQCMNEIYKILDMNVISIKKTWNGNLPTFLFSGKGIPLNIPTPTPAPDHLLGGHNELGGTSIEWAWGKRVSLEYEWAWGKRVSLGETSELDKNAIRRNILWFGHNKMLNSYVFSTFECLVEVGKKLSDNCGSCFGARLFNVHVRFDKEVSNWIVDN